MNTEEVFLDIAGIPFNAWVGMPALEQVKIAHQVNLRLQLAVDTRDWETYDRCCVVRSAIQTFFVSRWIMYVEGGGQ